MALANYAEGVNSRFVAIGVIMLAWGGPLPAQDRVSIDAAIHTGDKPYVQAVGEATISAKPDRAVVEIRVVTEGAAAMPVAAQNAEQTDTVVANLRKLLGGSSQLKTTSYSVQPNYQYPKPGAAPKVSGYVATNAVEVTLDDFALVSKVIDRALQSGATHIQDLRYGLKDPRAVHARALRQAAEEARAGAEAIATGLGLRVVRVLSAEELTSGDAGFGVYKKAPPPAPPPGTTLETAPPTPVEIGTIDVEAKVILRVEVGQ
jgi:uncharacterized protein